MLVVELADDDLLAAVAVGPQVLGLLVDVVGDQPVGGVEDRLGRAVVLLEQDGVGIGKVPLELEDVADVGAAERIDRLKIVADNGQVAVLLGQELQHPVLGAVGVLVLVDQHPAEDPAVLVAHVSEQLQQVDRAHQQVVEVHRARLDHPPLVEAVDVGDRLFALRVRRGGVVGGVGELVLGRRDRRLDRAGRESLRVELELLHAALDHSHRVGLVVDRERALVTQAGRLGAQDPGAGGMEGHHPHRPRDPPDQARDPLAHLVRGLVRERDREDLHRPRPVGRQQPGDPVGEHPGLARARAGEHQQRPLAVGDRLALRRVEPGQQPLDRIGPDLGRGTVGQLAAH